MTLVSISVVAAISGLVLGIVLARVIGRKALNALESKNRDLESQVARINQLPTTLIPPSQGKARVTLGEVAVVITAVAGLVASFGSIYTGSQKSTIVSLGNEKQAVEKERDDLKNREKFLLGLVAFTTDKWSEVQAKSAALPKAGSGLLLDKSHPVGDCSARRPSWRYEGTAPAMIECKAGPFMLKGTLETGAVVLIRKN